MLISIKQIIQEGYSYEDVLQTIEEAVHANHPNLDKRNPENLSARKELAKEINTNRLSRDIERKRPGGENLANRNDNNARTMSQQGRKHVDATHSDEFIALKNTGNSTGGKLKAPYAATRAYPRVISSAKQ